MKPLLLISLPSRHMWYSIIYTLNHSGFDKLYAEPWLPDNPHIILKEQTIFTWLSVGQTLQSNGQLIHPPTHIEARTRRLHTDSVICVIYCSMGTTNWHLFRISLPEWILKNIHLRNGQLFCLLHAKSPA